MIKRFISAFIVLILAFSLTGCILDPDAPSQGDSEGTVAAAIKGGTGEFEVEYTPRDLSSTWSSAAKKTVLSESMTITAAGTYLLSGAINDGQLRVEAKATDTVQLVLDGLSVNCSDGPALYIASAGKVFLTLADGTQNYLYDGTNYASTDAEGEPDGAVFAKADLTVNGSGTLTVESKYADALVSKDNLKITGGTLNITSKDDGIRGTDSVCICGGKINITANGDGIKSTKKSDLQKGYISIDGGEITIASYGDGLEAQNVIMYADGKTSIKTAEGSSVASVIKGTVNTKWGKWASASSVSTSAKGIKSETGFHITGGSITIDSSDDSIHSERRVTVSGGELKLSSGDDGIHASTELKVENGHISIAKSYEGIEGKSVTISGGELEIVANDDGINSASGSDTGAPNRPGMDHYDVSGDSFINISGGNIIINAGGDGIDSNNTVTISGGMTTVYGPTDNGNASLDYNTEAKITGGTFIAFGSSGMAVNFGESSTQCSILQVINKPVEAGTEVTFTNARGEKLLTAVPPKSFDCVIISMPEIKLNDTISVLADGKAVASVNIRSVITGSGFGAPLGKPPFGER